jgi:hypothetical protein
LLLWEVQLKPYDLVAVRLDSPDARLFSPEATVPKAAEAALRRRVRNLGQRAAVLRTAAPKAVLENPGFESQASTPSEIPGWAATRDRAGVEIRLDTTRSHDGKNSVRIKSQGPIAVLASNPFVVPATGRLTVAAWLRVPDAQKQPPLRLALEGDFGRASYRFASVGAPPVEGQPGVPIGTQWGQYVFQVTDLPLEPGRPVSVRFDLMGAGEVHVDDVEVYDLSFNRNELVELSKLISLIDVKLQNGQLGDCLSLLDGYWPSFLEQHVAMPAATGGQENLADRPTGPRDSPQQLPRSQQPERTGLLDRVRGLLPKKLW